MTLLLGLVTGSILESTLRWCMVSLFTMITGFTVCTSLASFGRFSLDMINRNGSTITC